MKSSMDADIELLSAYIDNQLDANERVALERRLEQDAALRTALGELRGTVALIRGLEPVRPPRSFALDPVAVRPRSAWQLPAVWMRLGSALAALLLALTLTLDLSGRGAATSTASMPSAPSAAGNATGGSAARSAVPTEAPLAASSAPESSADKLPEGTPEVAESVPRIASADATVAPASEAAITAAEATAAPAAESAADSAADSGADSAAASTAQESTASEVESAQSDPIAQNQGISESESSSPGTVEISAYSSNDPQVVSAAPRPLLIVEIALGALALLLLLASFWVARRRT